MPTLRVADEVHSLRSLGHDGGHCLSEALHLFPQGPQALSPIEEIQHRHHSPRVCLWGKEVKTREVSRPPGPCPHAPSVLLEPRVLVPQLSPRQQTHSSWNRAGPHYRSLRPPPSLTASAFAGGAPPQQTSLIYSSRWRKLYELSNSPCTTMTGL